METKTKNRNCKFCERNIKRLINIKIVVLRIQINVFYTTIYCHVRGQIYNIITVSKLFTQIVFLLSEIRLTLKLKRKWQKMTFPHGDVAVRTQWTKENLLTSTQSIEINAAAAGRLRCPSRLYGPTSTLWMNRILLLLRIPDMGFLSFVTCNAAPRNCVMARVTPNAVESSWPPGRPPA